MPLEGPDEFITLLRAAELSGVDPVTLLTAVRRGTLRSVRLDREHVTTRRWLHAYLVSRRPRGPRTPLPEGYVAPDPEG